MHRLTPFQHFALLPTLVLLPLLGSAARPAVAQPALPEQHAEEVIIEVPNTDETVLNLSAGGALNTGNTRSFQLTMGGDFRFVRGPHALGATTTFIYGAADLPDDDSDDYQDTARNLNSRARYDRFITSRDALFLAGVHRWDAFAGLDTRVQGQVGYLRNLYVQKEALRFWTELGYDITYDNYTQEVIETMAERDATDVDEELIVHSGRIFLGYDNHLTPTFTVLMGAESLINVEDPQDFRINWDNAFRSKINASLQLEVKFTLKYDNREVPGTRRTDTLTQINLIYALI